MGYDFLLEKRLEFFLFIIKKKKVWIIINMGVVNLIGVVEKVVEIVNWLNIRIKVVVVMGDDVLKLIDRNGLILEINELLFYFGNVIFVNVYFGVEIMLLVLEIDV